MIVSEEYAPIFSLFVTTQLEVKEAFDEHDETNEGAAERVAEHMRRATPTSAERVLITSSARDARRQEGRTPSATATSSTAESRRSS